MMMSEGLSVPECGALAALAYQELTSFRSTEKVGDKIAQHQQYYCICPSLGYNIAVKVACFGGLARLA